MPAADPAGVLAKHPELGLLEVAVPLWIEQVRHLPFAERQKLAAEAGQHIASHGDDLMFRGKPGKARDAFNALARGLAVLSTMPGGVTWAGMTWITRDCPDGGRCHHNCAGGCFRVKCCGPLSGVYPDDAWPAAVREANS